MECSAAQQRENGGENKVNNEKVEGDRIPFWEKQRIIHWASEDEGRQRGEGVHFH